MDWDFLLSGALASYILGNHEKRKAEKKRLFVLNQEKQLEDMEASYNLTDEATDIEKLKEEIYLQIENIINTANKICGEEISDDPSDMVSTFLIALLYFSVRDGSGEKYVKSQMFNDAISFCKIESVFSGEILFSGYSNEHEAAFEELVNEAFTSFLFAIFKFFENSKETSNKLITILCDFIFIVGSNLSKGYPLNTVGTSGTIFIIDTAQRAIQKIIDEQTLGE